MRLSLYTTTSSSSLIHHLIWVRRDDTPWNNQISLGKELLKFLILSSCHLTGTLHITHCTIVILGVSNIYIILVRGDMSPIVGGASHSLTWLILLLRCIMSSLKVLLSSISIHSLQCSRLVVDCYTSLKYIIYRYYI